MNRKSREKMMEETRIKLITTARRQFGTVGYANTVMDELTSQAGLTRGALYHHFGDKKGLFKAVLEQLDEELDARLAEVSSVSPNLWDAFVGRCHAYLRMAIEPEVQRIMLRDAPSVLDADHIQSMRLQCVNSIAFMLRQLMEQGVINKASPELLARFINGGLMDTALWIAESEDNQESLDAAIASLDILIQGLTTSNN
ncbi:TetR family transcriptional regulator [Vibrio sp. vnigr-6D03]|uniref:TetR/AcrR family transcriptional regulator n=1 Tax=Vibrio sp. vnigr-6D03 TaxID=2058088 RepID=UPI000C327C65|nr:TetR/AcrR family transcriptional regulator [Vibrio sp. vnigr-6D03]PKF79121.1 TetR family transcriptional regulator [Vibrio sp. vnigr-6D03]